MIEEFWPVMSGLMIGVSVSIGLKLNPLFAGMLCGGLSLAFSMLGRG